MSSHSVSETAAGEHHGHGHAHPPHLAHHFDTPQQQFESGKLGMWVFLATEILMFGGLFCAYAIYRANHPDIFDYAHRFLDTRWGAINTVVLLVSSFTMAWGVRAAQLGQRNLLVGLLALTLLGGCGFMVIKGIEYTAKFDHDLFPGASNLFYPIGDTAEQARAAHLEHLEHAYITSPYGAHGDQSEYGEDHGDHAHEPEAPHTPQATHPGASGPAAVAAADTQEVGIGEPRQWENPVDRSAIPPANQGPQGLAAGAVTVAAEAGFTPRQVDTHHARTFDELPPQEQRRVHIFFQIYFMMTGLHGIHVLIGMGLIGWILVRAWANHFGPAYFTPVDLVGLYWHLVDLIWIFLFPLLYLIH